MKSATRPACHVDRLACAWLIRRFIDPLAEFIFVEEQEEVPPDVIGFDIRGVDLSHHGRSCSFETFLSRYNLGDQALIDISRIVHEADLGDEVFDAPEAAGLDAVLTGLGLLHTDEEMLVITAPLFDGPMNTVSAHPCLAASRDPWHPPIGTEHIQSMEVRNEMGDESKSEGR